MRHGYDLESQSDYGTFEEENTRKAFVAKVFTIIFFQLLFTSGVVAFFVFSVEAQDFAREHIEIYYLCIGITVVIMLSMACCESVRRSSPINVIMLVLFTLAESFLMGFIASLFAPDTVLLAFGITSVVVFGLTLFALQTRCDFTAYGAIMLAGALILMVIGIVAIFFPSRTLIMVYCGIGIFMFSIYLIYDIQLILIGKHQYSLAPDEYVFGALSIYIDIINLFLLILTLLGILDN